MTDTKNPGEKLSVSSGKTLSLKPRTETGVVRQSFSHGRSKQVVVEKVKRRMVGAEPKAEATPAPVPEKKPASPVRAAPAARAAPEARPAAPAPAAKPAGMLLRTLTEEERAARARALGDARVREAEDRKSAVEDARQRAVREAAEAVERTAADARKREEEERHRVEQEAKR
jgi:translation initiation factor IF-2